MKFWFDTEFIEDGRTIDLISIGMVAEDGRQYYAVSSEFDSNNASQWVRETMCFANCRQKAIASRES